MRNRRRKSSLPMRFGMSWSFNDFDCELNLRVTPDIPARLYCLPENATPAEDGEVSVESALLSPPVPAEGPWVLLTGEEFLRRIDRLEQNRLADDAREEARFYGGIDDDEPDREEF